MSNWILWPAIILLFIGIMLSLLYAFQDRLIFYPQSISQTEVDRIARDYELSEELSFHGEDGKELHGWLVNAEQHGNETHRLLIYYGGNAEELSGQIPLMTDHLQDWSVLLVNYRGYGKSEGSPREESLYDDALLIFDQIQGRFDGGLDSLVLMGRSIGTGIATKVAAERDVNGLILISPFDSLTEVARHHYPFLPISTLLRYSFNSAERINDISAPVMVMAGDEDRIIPEKRTRALLEKKTGSVQYELMNGRGHNDIHIDPHFWTSIRDFLKSIHEDR
ncbi:alpha/beta hydrolase [Salipaludibacillus daqingensis]|uniref:alpha/beta hydrolase n=1 Tax=Salipaludibacillus daqingensis TaxID=3041001 RepID=UPI0024732760|nr:alpha/beta fold hydrolase [Salipaludibacillus daqingensis]